MVMNSDSENLPPADDAANPSKGFEGSYLGDASQLNDATILECKICWYQYDPELGDEVAQVAAGTPFSKLPAHWCCPQCEGDKDQFMIVSP